MNETAGRAFAPSNQGEERWNNMNQTDHPVEGFLRRNAPQVGQVMPDREGSVASRFPNEIEKGDPRDERYALRGKLLDANGILPGVGKASATDSDFEYFHKKALDAQEADWKAWFLGQMDLSTPEKQAYWQSKFPDVFQEKQRLMEKQIEIQIRLAKMRIFGPQNREDYMLLWSIQRGFIKVPEGPVFDPNALQKKQFHEGLFNIKKLFARSGTGYQAEFNPKTGAYESSPSSAISNTNVDFKDPLAMVTRPSNQRYSAITNFSQIGALQ